VLILEDEVVLPIKELAGQRFKRQCFLYSSGKKGQNEEEHRLLTVEIFFRKAPAKLTFFSANKKIKALRFVYQIFITQSNLNNLKLRSLLLLSQKTPLPNSSSG